MTNQESKERNSLVPYATSAALTCEPLGVDPATGLTAAEAAARCQQLGENRLPEPPRQSELRRFLRQMESPLVLVLIGAAVIATVVGFTEHGSFLLRFGDALAILLIVLLNALLGYFQEHRAESALRALGRLSVPRA
ncbi:MAG TPA: cation-transporting P-type ATPase, partial [Pseudomonadota bacterium]|nr:cation-transporting P-type ATPase [Pseudomonadota bacterium]